MRLIIQRVTQASVTVSGSVVGAINKGYLVLVGIARRWRSTAAGFAIHIICRLPKGQPPQLYCCRSTQNRRGSV